MGSYGWFPIGVPPNQASSYQMFQSNYLITLLQVIPTITSIRFVTGISSGILPGTSSAICSGISSGTLSGISSGISSDILSGILSGKSSGICSGKHSGTLSGISSGILSGRWGRAVLTELGRSQVEVQRCPVRSDSCSWGPAVPAACGSWRRAWRRVGKAEVNMEVEAEVVDEEDEEEEEKEKNNSDKI